MRIKILKFWFFLSLFPRTQFDLLINTTRNQPTNNQGFLGNPIVKAYKILTLVAALRRI